MSHCDGNELSSVIVGDLARRELVVADARHRFFQALYKICRAPFDELRVELLPTYSSAVEVLMDDCDEAAERSYSALRQCTPELADKVEHWCRKWKLTEPPGKEEHWPEQFALTTLWYWKHGPAVAEFWPIQHQRWVRENNFFDPPPRLKIRFAASDWMYEQESEKAFRERIHAELEKILDQHLAESKTVLSIRVIRTPRKFRTEHFEWLAFRICGKTLDEILAMYPHAGHKTTISKGSSSVARLIGLLVPGRSRG